MKSTTAILGVLFLVVASLLAVGIYSILDTGPRLPNPPTPPTGTDDPVAGGGTRRPTDVHTDPRGGQRPGPSVRRKVEIAGWVRDVNAAPVAGAAVRLLRPAGEKPAPESADMEVMGVLNLLFELDTDEWNSPRPLSNYARPPQIVTSGKGEIVRETTSLDDGSFRFELPLGLGAGPFLIHAEKDDVGVARASGVSGAAPVDLVLGQPHTIEGVVLSGAESFPVAAAWIRLDDGDKRWEAVTGADGQFRIEGLRPGHYRLWAGAEGHPPITDQLTRVGGDRPLEIRFPRGTRLRVQAVTGDKDDIPVSNAEVFLLEQRTLAYAQGTTDVGGWVEFPGLPAGAYVVNGRADEMASFSEETVQIDGQALVAQTTLTFEETVVTPITVVDDEGRPVEGVRFYTGNWDEEYDQARSMSVPGASDAQGKFGFRFEFMGPRSVLFAFKPGYAMGIIAPDDELEGTPVRVVIGSAERDKSMRIFGRVVTGDGTPIPDALVEFEITPADPDADDDVMFSIRSGADGRFDFPYCPWGEVWVAASTEEDFSDDVEVVPEPGKRDYEVKLEMELGE